MKLIIAIVSSDDSSSVEYALSEAKFYFTKLSSNGGFLKEGKSTYIIGCDDPLVDHAIEIIGKQSRKREEITTSSIPYEFDSLLSFPIKVNVGGATIFVLNTEQFIKI